MKVLLRLLLVVMLLTLGLSTTLRADDKYRNNTNYDTGRNYSIQEFQRLQLKQRNLQPKLPEPKIYQPKYDISFRINNILGTTWQYAAQNLGYNATNELTSLKLTVFDVSNEQTRKLVSDINIKSYGDDKNLKPAQFIEILNYTTGVKLTRHFTDANYEPSERWMNFKKEYAKAVHETNRQKMTMMMHLGEPDSFLLKSFTDTLIQDGQPKLITTAREIIYDDKDRIGAIETEIKDIAGDILKSSVKFYRDEYNGSINGFVLELTGPDGINYHKEFLNQLPKTIKDKLNVLAKNRIPVLEDDLSLVRIKDVKITNLPNLPNENGNPEPIVTVGKIVETIKKEFEPAQSFAEKTNTVGSKLPIVDKIKVYAGSAEDKFYDSDVSFPVEGVAKVDMRLDWVPYQNNIKKAAADLLSFCKFANVRWSRSTDLAAHHISGLVTSGKYKIVEVPGVNSSGLKKDQLQYISKHIRLKENQVLIIGHSAGTEAVAKAMSKIENTSNIFYLLLSPRMKQSELKQYMKGSGIEPMNVMKINSKMDLPHNTDRIGHDNKLFEIYRLINIPYDYIIRIPDLWRGYQNDLESGTHIFLVNSYKTKGGLGHGSMYEGLSDGGVFNLYVNGEKYYERVALIDLLNTFIINSSALRKVQIK